MDLLYTMDEKYLQAIEELYYGELPKALHLFNEIVNADPNYARAYYQLGSFYNYQFKDYQTAGFYYKKCIELEPDFPDVYEHYLKLLMVLKMHKTVEQLSQQALKVNGVRQDHIYESLGLYAETEQNYTLAKAHFQRAALIAPSTKTRDELQEHLQRIQNKLKAKQQMVYAYQG